MQNQMAMVGMNAPQDQAMDSGPMSAQLTQAGEPFHRENMNTYIYDYFLRNKHYHLCKAMIDSKIDMKLDTTHIKQSPNSRNVNGVDGMDAEERNLPKPIVPQMQTVENSFLQDWWLQFWDLFSATRNKPGTHPNTVSYAQQSRSVAVMQNEARNRQVSMVNAGQQYRMQQMMPNGMGPNNMKRPPGMNPNGPGPMGNMALNKQAMIGATAQQMQRVNSGMEMNGQRPQSPGSSENAPSPNKRPRVEGNMNPAGMAGFEMAQQGQNVQQQRNIEVYAQSLAQQQRMLLNDHTGVQAMNASQNSPMNHQLEGDQAMFAGNQPTRPGMAAGAPVGQPHNSHALQDYQMQLMLLEQQNKRRLLMARQEQDSLGTHTQGPGPGPAPGPGGFAPAMSPQGGRAGPSPNPADMKRGTPKLNQPGLPGSPMPDVTMQQRNSPAPNMGMDVNQLPPGMPPQYIQNGNYAGMPPNMMRPPTSTFNGQQMTPQQQMEAMRQNGGMQNGMWRGPQGMMPGQPQPQMGGPMGNPQQRNQMPPPPAPPAGEQPRTQEPSPQQSNQAPPTPSQQNKANPKKKATKDNKKPAKAKGANTGATPAASAEDPPPTPTPSTPITPMHKNSFAQNGQQPNMTTQPQPAAVASQGQPSLDNGAPPFGNLDSDSNNFSMDFGDFTADGAVLDDFNFDTFIETDNTDGLLNFDFGNEVQAGGDL